MVFLRLRRPRSGRLAVHFGRISRFRRDLFFPRLLCGAPRMSGATVLIRALIVVILQDGQWSILPNIRQVPCLRRSFIKIRSTAELSDAYRLPRVAASDEVALAE